MKHLIKAAVLAFVAAGPSDAWEHGTFTKNLTQQGGAYISKVSTGGDHWPYDQPMLVMNCISGSPNFYISYGQVPRDGADFLFAWDETGNVQTGKIGQKSSDRSVNLDKGVWRDILPHIHEHNILEIQWSNYAKKDIYAKFDLTGLLGVMAASPNECWNETGHLYVEQIRAEIERLAEEAEILKAERLEREKRTRVAFAKGMLEFSCRTSGRNMVKVEVITGAVLIDRNGKQKPVALFETVPTTVRVYDFITKKTLDVSTGSIELDC